MARTVDSPSVRVWVTKTAFDDSSHGSESSNQSWDHGFDLNERTAKPPPGEKIDETGNTGPGEKLVGTPANIYCVTWDNEETRSVSSKSRGTGIRRRWVGQVVAYDKETGMYLVEFELVTLESYNVTNDNALTIVDCDKKHGRTVVDWRWLHWQKENIDNSDGLKDMITTLDYLCDDDEEDSDEEASTDDSNDPTYHPSAAELDEESLYLVNWKGGKVAVGLTDLLPVVEVKDKADEKNDNPRIATLQTVAKDVLEYQLLFKDQPVRTPAPNNKWFCKKAIDDEMERALADPDRVRPWHKELPAVKATLAGLPRCKCRKNSHSVSLWTILVKLIDGVYDLGLLKPSKEDAYQLAREIVARLSSSLKPSVYVS